MTKIPVYDGKRMSSPSKLKVYKVVFSKYDGETVIVLARDFEEARKKALGWGQVNKYGSDLNSIDFYCEVDAV